MELSMPDGADAYAIQYSETGKAGRKELPPEAMSALFDVLDALAANPDAFPGRVRALSLDSNVRLYTHPSPPLQVTYQIDSSRRVLHLLHFVAPKLPVTRPVFISYSHEDAKWLDKLKQFLRPLEERELIRVWDDTEIRTGSDWLGDIRKALESARVAVFLVTQNFLDSPFVREQELPVLLDAATNRGCLIFVIAVSSSTIADSPLAKYQWANRKPLDRMPEDELSATLLEIYQKMKDAVSVQ
jgi:hypothetical protein